MKLSRKEKQAKKKLIGVYKQCIDVMTRYMEPVAVISTTKKGGTQITEIGVRSSFCSSRTLKNLQM